MSFDQMEYEDFSWIRWDRMRWNLVDLMLSSAAQHTDRERSFLCTGHLCCLDIQKISHHLGFEIHRNKDNDFYGHIDFCEDLQSQVTSAMRDGIIMVSSYIKNGSGHPLFGAMEVPREVGRIIHSPYFTNSKPDDSIAPHVSDKPSDEVRELLYAFVKLAFPDDYMTAVHQKNLGDSLTGDNELDEVPFGWDANAGLTQLFEDAGYVAPLLSTEIIEGLRGFPDGLLAMTEHFGRSVGDGAWNDLAGYSLDMGMEDASLRRYWEDFPLKPGAFVYSQHGNAYGTGMGFIARSSGLFVSQQVWDVHEDNESQVWNLCTKSFNTHLAGVLEHAGPTGAAMVIASDYRWDAYIVSSVEASWDEYAPMSAVLGPLPKGFGIVGVWAGFDERRYTPRSFDDIIEADWSEQITASAKYLRDCLAAVEVAKAKS